MRIHTIQITAVLLLAFCMQVMAQSWTPKGPAVEGFFESTNQGYWGSSIALSGDGNVAVVGDPSFGNANGRACLFRWNGSIWDSVGCLYGGFADDHFGAEVDISDDGNTVIIGTNRSSFAENYYGFPNYCTGYVKVYEYVNNNWVQKGASILGQGAFDFFGVSVSISADGNVIATSAANLDPLKIGSGWGDVRIYQWNGVSWVPKGTEVTGYERLGATVSISGDGNTFAARTYTEGGFSGDYEYIHIYEWDGLDWAQKGSGVVSLEKRNLWGRSIALSFDGNTFVSGEPRHFSAILPTARVFEWNGTTWNQKGASLLGSAPDAGFGHAVDMDSSGNFIAVASPWESDSLFGNEVGFVRTFQWTGADWLQTSDPISAGIVQGFSGDDIALTSDAGAIAVGTPVFFFVTPMIDGRFQVYDAPCPNYGLDNVLSCDSFTWTDGNTYAAPSKGVISDTFLNANGCDSVVYLNLDTTPYFTIEQIETCGAFTWIDGMTYYSDNDTASFLFEMVTNGCDSIVQLDFTFMGYSSLDEVVACDSFTWIDGITYYSDNDTATFVAQSANGCDSIVQLDLSFGSFTTTEDVTACDSFTWIDGNTYFGDNNSATFTLQASDGCDSVIYLDLTFPVYSGIDEIASCDSFTWIDGNTYFGDNNSATFTLQAVDGCDSVIHLDLSFPVYYSIDEVTSCDSFTWIDGNTYFGDNNSATFTLQAADGCDSITQLNLDILPTLNTNVLLDTGALSSLQDSATYQWVDCQNYAPITGETNQTFTPAVSGSYAVILNAGTCQVDTSDCFSVGVVSAIENMVSKSGIKISPNPFSSELYMTLDKAYPSVSIAFLDVLGRRVSIHDLGDGAQFDLEPRLDEAGVYLVEIRSNGVLLGNMKLVRE